MRKYVALKIKVPMPKVKATIGSEVKFMPHTTETNLMKLTRKITHNVKVC